MTSATDTTCPLDCPDACSLSVTVEDGKVVGVSGTHRNPLTAGYICSRVRDFAKHMYGSERLTTPLVRTGVKGEGVFRVASWDEALDRIVAELGAARDEHGGESILPLSYGGSNGYVSQDTTDARLFRRLGASRLDRTLCAAAVGRAFDGLYGRMAGVAISDYVHSRLIVVWGANPHVSGIHHVPFILEAKKAGARVVVIDPRRTKLARTADLHLALRPGTDLPVALAILNALFEGGAADHEFLAEHTTGAEDLRDRAAAWPVDRAAEVAGLDPADLQRLIDWYSTISPAVVRCGWGLERNRNGGSACAAVLALAAVGGKFGVRGGGFSQSNSGIWDLDSEAAVAVDEVPTRSFNMNRIGRALLEADPAIRCLFVYNCNALMTLPEQRLVRRGLERDDLFTVVFDQVMTDTALYADVVLPATTFLEHEELSRGYGAMVLQQGSPVVAPHGESRPNVEVFADIAARMGLSREGEPSTSAEVRDAILDASAESARLRKGLDEVGIVESGKGHPIQFVDLFPGTDDRRVHLVPEELDEEAPGGLYHWQPDPATERHPLALISPSTAKTTSSTFGQLQRGVTPVMMHPADASSRTLKDGDPVRIYNDRGEVHCPVKIDDTVRPGVASLPKGLWSHNTLNGETSNALSPDSLTDLGAGACFNDARVQIERLKQDA